jgi:predicted PurR-regulated permease PerM
MNSTIPRHFFFGLLIAVTVLTVLIYRPFLTPLVLAAALAVIFRPIHFGISRVFFRGKERSSISALLTLLIVVIIVLLPLLLVGGKIYGEIQNMYAYLIDETGHSQVVTALNSITTKLHLGGVDSLNINDLIKNVLQWLFANLDDVFRGTSKVVMGLFIMFLALFYFLRDGRELKRQIIALSPLGNADDERILTKMEQAVYSIFAGSIAVGIIQGIMTGIGFALFHVPNPALWGAVAAVAALIPGVGTSLVLVPGIAYLYLTGSTNAAIGLLIWSLLAVGLIDNLLGPILINRGIKIHPFLILLSVLGGLIFFGPIGFVLGPIILALLFALLDMYRASYARTQW